MALRLTRQGNSELGLSALDLVLRGYSRPEVDRIWLWVYDDKLPIYPIFYLLKRDYRGLRLEASGLGLRVWILGFRAQVLWLGVEGIGLRV